MEPHVMTAEEVHKATREVVDKYHQIASAPARYEGRKRLAYNPFTCTWQVTTDNTETTFKNHAAAAEHYSAK
jgi:hypothetical protein